ncbi:carbohydrate ABC transporter permease [Acidothermaceae bacterium B102]|nr:carbohydrate ABC transporter permease [Acidothermaceae bacterium B102]
MSAEAVEGKVDLATVRGSVAPTPTLQQDKRRAVVRKSRHAVSLLLMLVFALIMVAPVWWVFITAIAPDAEAFNLPPNWFPIHWNTNNFGHVLDLLPLGQQALNSVEIVTCITVGALVTSTLAAYGFARFEFRGKNVLFLFFLAGLMVPPQSTVIPLFLLMRHLHLIDHKSAIVLPGLVSALGIFLLRQYIESIPRELDDAAKIDGLGHLGVLRHVIIPLASPAISALGIFVFLTAWNDFFWPSTVLSSAKNMTLPVGLASLLSAQGDGEATVIFAAITLVVLPLLVLFLIFQRSLVQSIASTGIKG